MTRTITAFFDDRSDAQAAVERLQAAGLGADDVRIHDKSSPGYRDDSYSSGSQPGIWASIKNAFLPDDDRHAYEEGVRRGGYLVTADVDEARADAAVRVLEEANTIDIDERSQQWRAEGWNRPAQGLAAVEHTGSEQAIPVVEEQLVVGKREVARGGVKVRSYVTETPVHEQVRLREQHVEIERVPVNQPLSAVDDAFQERSIEVSTTGEEAVIGKTARVVEEVRVFNSEDERVEDVQDTVRRTDVDIEDTRTRPEPR
ncbi:YsnF/AvaK domain-containing protein [Phenylobacterium deserti]|uniref:DUF2382 domain-containing protein n=1 Tax=Phenylobacterium deserti TaxID=1914756 RepID=A0A328AJG5_9CAUL|nr:YsnF/AvaK domain-containing protein [Phenylobacterium deserti]RAK53008.1 hypothetical protein DJ018_10850 [Phenylobacterium deserti]